MNGLEVFQNITVTQPSVGSLVAIGIAVTLLLCSGFVSASEIAFFSLTPRDMEEVEEEKHSSDEKISRLLAHSERLLATILILNNLVNVAIIMLLNFALMQIFNFKADWVEFLLMTVLLTFLLLLFGEVMPKIYSAQHRLRFCRVAAPVYVVLNKLFYPLSSLLVRSKGLTERIMAHHEAEALTVDDLEQALELTDKREIAEEGSMLEGIIRFGGETVREVMTPRVDMVDLEMRTPFPEVLQCIIENNYSRIPVYSETEDNIKGVLYIKDLLPHLGKPANFRWQSLVRPPYFVPETKMIDDLLRDFQKEKVHIAIVVDEFGGTSGIVTMEDILEEIVGEIDDEYDDTERPYMRMNQNTYLFDGKCPLSDFLRVMQLNDDFFEEVEGEADTLGGLLLEIKGGFPALHERITYRHLVFEVNEVDKRRIVKIKTIIKQ